MSIRDRMKQGDPASSLAAAALDTSNTVPVVEVEKFETTRLSIDMEVELVDEFRAGLKPDSLTPAAWLEAAWIVLREHPKIAAKVIAIALERKDIRRRIRNQRVLKNRIDKLNDQT